MKSFYCSLYVAVYVVQAILQKGNDETVSGKQNQNEKLSKPAASAGSHKVNKKETEVDLHTYCSLHQCQLNFVLSYNDL